ncbi:MAG TPA: Spy/CpxP family protein refolding chaperone [Vicinamibacterales bacterium]|nr:Spy/CpxP family protein refolding chaperone [Vicinamibacterales bacterium]
MMPTFRGLLVLCFALAVPRTVSAQPMQWWKLEPVKNEIGLTSEQSTRIEGIFQESMVELRQKKTELDHLEGKLSNLIETMADEAQVTRQIDRVESVRAAMNKARTLMLLHIRQVLSGEQRVKLNAVYARWEQERRGREKERSAPDGNRRPGESGRLPN